MRIHQYDSLRTFVEVAKFETISAAADSLNMTKGAISHLIARLENDIEFKLFERSTRGIKLTFQGRNLLSTAEEAFESIEDKVSSLSDSRDRFLTIGVTTYFASRWLSPRLMDFLRAFPDTRLRIQPVIDLLDLERENIDIAIRWGDGNWHDCVIQPLFNCPAWPTGNREAFDRVQSIGLKAAFSEFTLLRDREGSNAWSEWYDLAGLNTRQRADALIIPDPNVRVQAVLDGQGVALNDELVGQEIRDGKLFKLSEVELGNYGYFLAYQTTSLRNQAAKEFIAWLDGIKPANATGLT